MLTTITVAGVAARRVYTLPVAHVQLALVYICKGRKRKSYSRDLWVGVYGNFFFFFLSLTIAGLGGEVIFETKGTLALVHAQRVDTFSHVFTDTGVHQAFINIWKRVRGGNGSLSFD